MVFSDLLADPEPIIAALRRLRHGGHDVILFHILDEAEVAFPVRRPGRVGRAGDARHGWRSTPTASAATTCRRSKQFRETYRRECFQSGIDYVPLDTSMPFDRALTEYLAMRRSRAIGYDRAYEA